MNQAIAVILVNYNGYKDTIECLDSINTSDYSYMEIFVVDNASTDDSVELLDQYKNRSSLSIHIIVNDENLGFSGGNNVGLKEALKDQNIQYFLFLNNDTLIEPNCFSELVYSMSGGDVSIGKIMYAYDRKRIWYAGGSVNPKTLKPCHFGYNEVSDQYDMQSFVTFATGCCICMSRNCIDRVGFWDESFFLYEEDVDYSIRVIRNNLKIMYNPKAIIYHKVGASTGEVSGLSEIYQVRNRYWLIKKHLTGADCFYAYLYNLMLFINRIRKGEYRFLPMIKGISAFIKGEVGKYEGPVN